MAFDFSECLDYMTDGRSTVVLTSVVYTSILIALVVVGIMYLIFYQSLPSTTKPYFKAIFYVFVATMIIISMHYSSVSSEFANKYDRHKIDDIVDGSSEIPSNLLTLEDNTTVEEELLK